VTAFAGQVAAFQKDIEKAKAASAWAETQIKTMEQKMTAMNKGPKADFD